MNKKSKYIEPDKKIWLILREEKQILNISNEGELRGGSQRITKCNVEKKRERNDDVLLAKIKCESMQILKRYKQE